MRITVRFFAFLAIGFLLSCSQKEMAFHVEDEPVEEQYEPAEDYLQLRAGNYWVYESYSINLVTGEEKPLHKRDSIYVLKDTLIGRTEFFILEGSRLGQAYRAVLRCSGPEVMDAGGRLLFSTAAIGDTVNLPADQMAHGAEAAYATLAFTGNVAAPYGTFDALEYRRTFYFSSSEGIRAGGNVRRQSDFFAKGVGLIQYTSFFPGQPLDIEMRLARSNVQ